ncbi:hypothetical protein AB0758_43870 [Tolypothrix bouteillei VB521301_2]|uniref:hypothetical protein n=1 Tax=Tolypothrix bouteillei TaxID=1246981 RepID=UPI0005137F0B
MTPPQDSERISKDKISGAIEALRGLDAKELPDVPAKVAIRKMRRQIERVLKLGYTYDEVSEVLAGLDINISGNRIKYLLGEVRKETRSRKKKADSEAGGTDLGDSSESHSPSGNGEKKNGEEPQSKERSAPWAGAKLSQTQSKPQPQEQSSTVDTDDYQPMTLRRR